VTDQFAIGSFEAMMEYAAKPLPFETNCCESFVDKNMHYHCFSRNNAVIEEELTSLEEFSK
jgi:hypothetical protein